MTRLFDCLTAIPVERLASVLVHSLWQGLVSATGLALVLRRVTGDRPRLRYGLSLSALCSVVLATCMTWSLLTPTNRQTDRAAVSAMSPAASPRNVNELDTLTTSAQASATGQPVAGAMLPSPSELVPSGAGANPAAAASSFWASLGVGLWLVGTLVMLVRGVRDLAVARRLASGPESTDGELRAALDALLDRVGLSRGMKIVLTEQLATPAVWGLWRPVLLWPSSLVGSLTPDETAAILAHELAHILRCDQWTLVLQLVIESLLFFNPAVWWIGRHIRQEREACCDAFAADVLGSPADYARVLADQAEKLSRGRPRPASISAFATDPPGSLLDRVRRLLLPGYRPAVRISWGQCAVLLLVSLTLLYGVHKTTDLSVSFAREILSDAERVEQIADVASEVAPQTLAKPAFDKVRITGRIVRDPALASVPGLHVGHKIRRSDHNDMSGTQAFVTGEEFDLLVPSGLSIMLTFEHSDTASSYLGPFGPRDGPLIENQVVHIVPGESKTIRVLDADGQPAAGVRVGFSSGIDGRNFSGISRAVETDEHGVATVPHLRPENQYRLGFSGPGYQPKPFVAFDPFGTGPTVFEVLRAQSTRGIVTDAAGQPLEGVEVRIFKTLHAGGISDGDWFGAALAVTDAAGSFELTTLSDGMEYVLLLERSDHARSVISHVHAGDLDVRGTMTPGIEVRGRIERGSNAEPWPKSISWHEWLNFEGIDGREDLDNWKNESASVDSEGRFTLAHVNPGQLGVYVHRQEHTFHVSARQNEIVIKLPSTQPESQIAGAPGNQVARRPVIVRFTHNGQPVQPRGKLRLTGRFPPAIVSTSDWAGAAYLFIEEGVARFDLPVTALSLRADADDLIGFWFNNHDLQLPDIHPGTEPVELTIEVQPAGAVSGRILHADGTPAANASASVSCTFDYQSSTGRKTGYSGGRSVNTDIAGRYLVSPIPVGAKGTLAVTAGQYRHIEGTVTVTKTSSLVSRDIQLGPTDDAFGVVVDPEGRPIRSLPLTLVFSEAGSSHTWAPPAATNVAGRFRFEGLNPHGRYLVDTSSRRDWLAMRAELKFGQSNRIVLQRGQVVEGQVLDEAGHPVAGVEVHAVSPDFQTQHNGRVRFESEGRTDAQGRFRFSNLPEAKLKFFANEVWNADQEIDTTSGQELILRGRIADWYRARRGE